MVTCTASQNTLDGWCIEKGKICCFANLHGICQLTACINQNINTYKTTTNYTPDIPEDCPFMLNLPPACRTCTNRGKGPCWCILGSPKVIC